MGVTGVQQLDRDWSRKDRTGTPPYPAEPSGADLIIQWITAIKERPSTDHERRLPLPAALLSR
jgi:hypothetical protein